MAFEGFPQEGIAFLRDLKKHNDRDWFKARKQVYETGLKAPGLAFVEAMAGPMRQKLSPHVQAIPVVGRSIFRQHRDTRFSKDKSPYKDHFDMWFWEGPPEKTSWSHAGYYLRLQPPKLLVGGGMHRFDKETLARYRTAVAEDKTGKPLEAIVNKLEKAGLVVEGSHYKRVPRGFDPEHPRAALLKHQGLYATVEGPIPDAVYSKAFVTYVMKVFQKAEPLTRWLTDHVAGA